MWVIGWALAATPAKTANLLKNVKNTTDSISYSGTQSAKSLLKPAKNLLKNSGEEKFSRNLAAFSSGLANSGMSQPNKNKGESENFSGLAALAGVAATTHAWQVYLGDNPARFDTGLECPARDDKTLAQDDLAVILGFSSHRDMLRSPGKGKGSNLMGYRIKELSGGRPMGNLEQVLGAQ